MTQISPLSELKLTIFPPNIRVRDRRICTPTYKWVDALKVDAGMPHNQVKYSTNLGKSKFCGSFFIPICAGCRPGMVIMMKRVILLLMLLLIMVTLSACNKSKGTNSDNTEACEKDLIATLEELRSNTINEKSYIYSPNLFVVDSSSDFSNEINQKIAGLVEYTVKDVAINGESADARVKLIAPDVYHLITEIASEMQENNVDRLLEQLNDELDEDVPTKEYEVIVGLRLVNEHWYLVPTGELSNAFSGGIIEQFSMMGQNIIESLLEVKNDG